MNFDLTPEQAAVEQLAQQLLGDLSTPESLRQVERDSADRIDRDLWSAMADAGLLSLVVPEPQGGAGLGVVELCLLLREVGRRAAAVPAFAALALGALPIARLGTDLQRQSLLRGVATGSTILTAALVDPLGDPLQPDVQAVPHADGWRLDGRRTNVPAGTIADVVLVPATVGASTAVFVVHTGLPGVHRSAQTTTSGTPEAMVELDGVVLDWGDRVGTEASSSTVLSAMVDLATVASCAVMAGAAAEAVRLTGEYTTERLQFGRPIASFQAVTQRAADAWVDAQAIELTMLQAAWRLDAGLPADREVAVAKFFAAEAGQRAVHAAQHLHGGMGVDRDYPLHRYFLLAKQHELFLGGTARQLLRLGGVLAEEGATRPAS